MRPILFTLGPLTISSYPVMICLGACLAVWLTLREIDRRGLDRSPYITICLIGFSSGIVGARIMNCIVFYDLYRGKPWWKMIALWEGGLAMYGGVLLAVPLCYVYIRCKGLSFWQVADTLAPPWMMLLIVARLGCFLNGCCYGKPTTVPWGIFSRGSARLSGAYTTTHPTQLYDSLAGFVVLWIMWRARLKPRFTGHVSLIFPILYPIARFAIEFYRADPRGMWRFSDGFTLSESQILSIPLFLFGLGAWAVLSRHGVPTE
jgi:phosphatidylglycerol---prolipoprotein diacylglyceryl transferase